MTCPVPRQPLVLRLMLIITFSGTLASACRNNEVGLGIPTERATLDGGGDGLHADGGHAIDDPGLPPSTADAAGSGDATRAEDAAGAPACTLGAVRCAVGAAIVEVCIEGGAWQVKETCASICSNGACVGKCRPGDRRCGANQTPELCTAQGDWMPQAPCAMVCAGAGQCAACAPDARRCNAAGTAVEQCGKDGAGYADIQACPDGCQAGKCNLCSPGARLCAGLDLRTCRSDGSGWDEQPCKPPPGGGGEAVCSVDHCDVTCAPGRIKTGNQCACPMATAACGGACVPATESIDVPEFNKMCALPVTDSCDPYNFPIMIQGCAKVVEVVFHAAATHCAPIYLQVLANGVPKGPRTDAIPPGQFSVPIKLGRLGPGPVTLGFQATIARTGCGVAGLLSGWSGSARISVAVP
jgi:hypothetical protein